MSNNQLLANRLLDSGYTKVGGHIWGGGFWGEAKGKKAWTGHNGEVMEYWNK
jgi:hypothetical protein